MNLIKQAVTIMLLCAGLPAYGQQVADTVYRVDRVDRNRPWLHTTNAAGLGESALPAAGQTWLGGHFVQGDFRRVQQPESTRELLFFSEGYHPVQKGVVYGSFQYKQQEDLNIQLNDVMDPYRGTPYLLADSIGGDWKKQSYSLQLKAASGPLLHQQLRAGLGIDYKLATGARQNDPRPLNNVNDLQLFPGLTWQLYPAHTIGLNGYFGAFQESVSLQNKNTNRTQLLYKLLGMGQYEVPTILSVSASRYYKGKRYGGDVQYHYQSKSVQVLVAAGYRSYKEEVTDGSVTPLKGGTLDETSAHASVEVLYKQHRLSGSYVQYDRTGTETQYVRNRTTGNWDIALEAPFSTSYVQQGQLTYEWRQDEKWRLHAGISYNGFTNKYLLSASSQQIDNMNYTLMATRSWSHLDLCLQGDYTQNLQQSLNYQLMSTTSNLIAYKLLYPDQTYLSAEAWGVGFKGKYNFHFKEAPRTWFFIRGLAAVRQPL